MSDPIPPTTPDSSSGVSIPLTPDNVIERLESMTSADFFSLKDSEMEVLSNYCKENPLAKLKLSSKIANIKLTDVGKISRRQSMPYYNRKYAEEVIPILEHIKTTKQSVDLRWKDFYPAKQETVRQRIQQSLQFVIDHLDPLKIYKEIRLSFELRPKKHALRFEIINTEKPLKWGAATDLYSLEEIKEEIQNFADMGQDGTILLLPDLSTGLDIELKESDMVELKEFIERFEFLMYKFDTKNIKVTKRVNITNEAPGETT